MKKTNPFLHPVARRGFTLVEVMIVVAIIALLSVLAVPALQRARTNAQRVRLLKELKATAEGFEMYAADHIKLPLETSNTGLAQSQPFVTPAGMEPYMPKNSHWKDGSYGTWYWMYWPDANKPYKGFIYLLNNSITDDDIAYFDKQLDDGNMNTGSIINYGGGQLLYFIQ